LERITTLSEVTGAVQRFAYIACHPFDKLRTPSERLDPEGSDVAPEQ